MSFTVNIRVAASEDDGTKNASTYYNNNAYGRLGNSSGSWKSYWRFQNVAIPQGATIISATIDLRAYADSTLNETYVKICGNNVNDAVAPTGTAELDALALTLAEVDWDITSSWVSGSIYSTPDLASIISEITSRPGWASGADLAIIVLDDGSTANNYKPWDAWDSHTATAPILNITYEGLNYEEEGTVTVVSIATEEDLQNFSEIQEVIAQVSIAEQDLHGYFEDREVLVRGIVKSLIVDPRAPVVKGRKPRPVETVVITNQPVQFYLCAETDDGVNISTVQVTIDGVIYDNSDPEFTYSGSPEAYLISVQHPDWSNEQTVTVVLSASSLCGEVMTPVSYTFETEWVSTKDRTGYGKVELYEAGGDYGYDILTLEEDWVRQGTERFSPELEVWWGRYQKLPYIENLEMRIEAGITNSRGKEILDNGYLSVKVDDGSYVPLLAESTINLGPMFTHTHRSLFFKLLVPEGAATKKYFVLSLLFEPQMFFPYGRFRYGRGIYQNAGNMIDMNPNNHLYRSYVFDATMWNQLLAIGISASPLWRGQDKKW